MQVTNPGTDDPKELLRRRMRVILRESTLDLQPVLAGLAHWLDAHRDAAIIAVFSALPGEPDLTKITMAHPGRRWVYPRVDGRNLILHLVKDPATELVAGAFGILEPSPTLPQVTPTEIDAFLCPGMAFDACGGRLGRGKGYYDRLLAHARQDALKIGICFPCQLVASTHCQEHDIRMDQVISGG